MVRLCHLALFLLLSALIFSNEATIVLKPDKISDNQVGFIFVQGAEIPARNYISFATTLQSKFNGSLWIGLLNEFPLDLPNLLEINSAISRGFEQLKSNGFNYTTRTPFFFAGHSLGGVVLINYLVDSYESLSTKCDVRGVVLEGSFVPRVKLNLTRAEAFPPVLTLGAELDGLARISRMAEAFYHDSQVVF